MLERKEKIPPKQKLNLLLHGPSKRPPILSSRSPHPPPTSVVTAMSGIYGSQHCSSCWQLSTEHHLQESLKCIMLAYLVLGPFFALLPDERVEQGKGVPQDGSRSESKCSWHWTVWPTNPLWQHLMKSNLSNVQMLFSHQGGLLALGTAGGDLRAFI